MPEQDFEAVIKKTRTFLTDIEESLKSNSNHSIKFSFLVGNFYEFYEEWEMFSLRFRDRFTPPEDINLKIKGIAKFIRSVILNDDQSLWEDYVKEGMEVLQRIKSTIPTDAKTNPEFIKEKTRFIEKTISHILEIHEAIKECEEKFKEKFNPFLVGNLNLLIRAIENKMGTKLLVEAQDRNLCKIEVEVITSDKVLDLYEEIKKMKRNTKEKKRKQALLKAWTEILAKEGEK